MQKKDILDKLKSNEVIDFFKKNKLNTVILFGSICNDEFSEYSDIDIAIIADEKISIDQSLDIEFYLGEVFNREIDLIDLLDENLDIFLKINILNDNKIIYNSDNFLKLNFIKETTEFQFKENENYFYFRRRDILE